ncbi:MAG: DUF1064 domain-containing protein [Oscillospiraceae bacterium]|nr:DUF1064 domain-containing protein [Oscillospiraceae bacterium]
MHLELNDLPPKYRAQAERQIAARGRSDGDALATAARAAKATEKAFDSKGEYEYYISVVLPGLARGEILRCEQHPRFLLFPEGEYDGVKLRAIRYTADFRLDRADGTVEIVEIKSQFVKRMQRDYHIRKRIFIETVARPNGWRFREQITDDTKDEQRRWRELTREGGA